MNKQTIKILISLLEKEFYEQGLHPVCCLVTEFRNK